MIEIHSTLPADVRQHGLVAEMVQDAVELDKGIAIPKGYVRHQSGVIVPAVHTSLDAVFWPHFNTADNILIREEQRGKPILQYRMHEDMDVYDVNGGNDPTPILIQPNARVVIAKAKQFMGWSSRFREIAWIGAANTGKSYVTPQLHIWHHLRWRAQGIFKVPTALVCESQVAVQDRLWPYVDRIYPKWLGEWVKSDGGGTGIFHIYDKWGAGKIYYRFTGTETEVRRWDGEQYAIITFDELTKIPRFTYDYLKTRNRWAGVPLSILGGTSNPGGRGHRWVVQRFVNKTTRPANVGFIQAYEQENPYSSKEYAEGLAGIEDEKLRRAKAEGRYDVFEGKFFDELERRIHLIEPIVIPDEIPKYYVIDHGTNHPTACMWFAVFPPTKDYPRGHIRVYRYYEKQGKWADEHKRNIWALMREDKNIMLGGIGHDAFAVKGSTFGDKTVAQRYMSDDGDDSPSFNIVKCGGPNTRKQQWAAVHNLLSFQADIPVNFYEPIRSVTLYPKLLFQNTPDVLVAWRSLNALVHRDGDPDDLEKVHGSVYGVGQGDESASCLGMGALLIGPPELVQQQVTVSKLQEEHEYRDNHHEYANPYSTW